MNEEQQAAYVIAMSASTMISAMGMHAENTLCVQQGKKILYSRDAFETLLREAGLHHNGILTIFGR